MARIVMVAENGTRLHLHTIQNLSDVTTKASPIGINQTTNSSSLSLPTDASYSIVISGFADITANEVTEWRDVAVTISISNGNVMSIIPNPAEVDHFYGLPIYGIVTSLTGKSVGILGPEASGIINGTFHGKGAVDDYFETGPVNETSLLAGDEENATDFAVLDSSRSEIPIIQKLSEDGNYIVQMRRSQATVYPLPGLDYNVFFLYPVQPHATEAIVPPWESNLTGASILRPSIFIDPSVLLNFEPVDSYDMTVYSETGNVLWQKDDLNVYGGRDHGLITFSEEKYRGPITIEITDIKRISGISDDPAPEPDSVTFISFFVR